LDESSQRTVASWNDGGEVVATLKITFLGSKQEPRFEALAATS
jgi:hypothetical protein